MSSRETIIIEPRSRIASFDTLGYHTIMAVNGAIAGTLFGKDKDKKNIFYKSSANRRNKQVLAHLTSEIYAYLNSIISDFADPEDYFFRLWVRVEISKKTGQIVNEPLFEVDLFKYAGKLGGRYVEVGDYALEVVLIGREGTHIAPLFTRGISHVATATKLVRLKTYESFKQAPENIRAKITPDAPFLILDGNPMEIKITIDEEKNIVIPFVEKGKQRITFETQDSVESFILGQIELKPKIRKSGTIFQLVDDELRKIQTRIQKDAHEGEEPDLLKSLRLKSLLTDLESKLQQIDVKKLSKIEKETFQNYSKQLEKWDEKYTKMSREWEGLRADIRETKRDMKSGEITYEQFSTIRVRRSKALKSIEQNLIDIQEEFKRDLPNQIKVFLEKIGSKKIEKK